MSEFSEKMGMEVGNNFKQGFNCCEAIVETFRKEAGVDIDDNALRLCSGFGGGIGHARHICGALVQGSGEEGTCRRYRMVLTTPPVVFIGSVYCTAETSSSMARKIFSRSRIKTKVLSSFPTAFTKSLWAGVVPKETLSL